MSMRCSTSWGVVKIFHLHLVDDGGIVVEKFGMQNFAEVANLEALVFGGLADADPVDVTLAHVPDAFGAVDQVVDLALEDGLEVGLHLAPGHFHPDADGQRGQVFSVGSTTTSSISGPMTSILPSSTSVSSSAVQD